MPHCTEFSARVLGVLLEHVAAHQCAPRGNTLQCPSRRSVPPSWTGRRSHRRAQAQRWLGTSWHYERRTFQYHEKFTRVSSSRAFNNSPLRVVNLIRSEKNTGLSMHRHISVARGESRTRCRQRNGISVRFGRISVGDLQRGGTLRYRHGN